MPGSPLMLTVSKCYSRGVFAGRLGFRNGRQLHHLLDCLRPRTTKNVGHGNVIRRASWSELACWRLGDIRANAHNSGGLIATRGFDPLNRGVLSTEVLELGYSLQESQFRHLSRSAEEKYSDDEYLAEDNVGTSPSYANVDDWRWKFNMLLRNAEEEELKSWDKKDRRDYEHLATLAKHLGLYSQNYGRAVVFSKVPLPNYRPDLDDKRPVRKVSIPPAIQNVVDSLLQEHLDRKRLFKRLHIKDIFTNLRKDGDSTNLSSINRFSGFALQKVQTGLSGSEIADDILHGRSMRLLNKQRAWQESPEGQKMMAFRMSLPAYKEKAGLLSTMAKHQVLVVSGETGCGKTTQLPQYILESEIEAGRGSSCNIICTQPRRISAMSVAERVASERGEELGDSVGYKVRLEGMKGRATRLLFCTTGILLRRLIVDPILSGVSHVIVDEIHERGMNEDFLLIVLKGLLARRPDLKLLLMSATLNAELFSSYFGGAPTCHIPGFTHPVNAHFLENILELTGHRLTEQNQLDDYGQDKVWKMQKQIQNRKRKNHVNCLVEDALANADFQGYSGMTQDSLSQWSPEGLGFNLIEALLCHIYKHEREGAVLVFMTGWEDINALKAQLQLHPLLGNPGKVLILPCHGSMGSAEQKLIFNHPPANVRKIVLATNMAETSITINDVVFVVDCGKAKETSYDALNNTPCLLPTWISKASARQRRGRAGRVQPGECYHLYPRAVHDAFAEYQLPELLRTPLDSLCLQIKSLKLGSIKDFLSKALQPPEPLSVENSIGLLKTIGALDEEEELTHLGKHLSMLPVEPRIGKMLIMGSIFRCLDPILTIAAGLNTRDPFVVPGDKKTIAEDTRFRFGSQDSSDHIAIVRAYDGWREAMKEGTGPEYCWRNFLSIQTLREMHSLRKQFKDLLTQCGLTDEESSNCNEFSNDRDLLGGVICAGLFPGVASVLAKSKNTHFKTVEDGQVLLYQGSVLSKMGKINYPWLVFNEKVKTGTVIIRDSTGVSDSMLLLFGGKVELNDKSGCLLMHNGWLEFYMLPELAEMILDLRKELDDLLCRKLESPKLDVYKEGSHLIMAVLELLHADKNLGKFGFIKPGKVAAQNSNMNDVKGLLQSRLQREGYKLPVYQMRVLKNNMFQSRVGLLGRYFIGKAATSKKQAQRNAATDALNWLDMGSGSEECKVGLPKNVGTQRKKPVREGREPIVPSSKKIVENVRKKVTTKSKLNETEATSALKDQIRQMIRSHRSVHQYLAV